MTDASSEPTPGPRWLPWVCLGLLVLPFHPLWLDFEQVRRGLLLVLVGALLCAMPRLPTVRGGGMGLLFVGGLCLSALVQLGVQSAFHDDNTPWSFQPWEAAYRIAHWLALLVIVRIGSLTNIAAMATPVASLLLATSAFGLLQRLGIAEIGGYGVEREPVSTLGNLNVASEWTAVAIAATAVLLPHFAPRRRWLAIAALACGGAYLIVNPSRSGKVAATIGLVLLALMRRQQRGWLPLAITAGGALLGAMLVAATALPQLDKVAMRKELERGTVTLQVRFEIARGAMELLKESPVFGKGPGQFQVEYPRHRSQKEIEASSFERQFTTEVRTAHDDWLELLVDGGLPMIVLFGAMLFALQRGQRDKSRLVPMFVLLLLMFVRAPVFNAPAAALAFWLVGTRNAPTEVGSTRRWLGIALAVLTGLTMLVLGVLPIAGNSAFAPYLRARRDGQPTPVEAAASAGSWMPFEPRWLEVQAREAMNDRDLQLAAHLTAKALQLRPFSPPLLLLLAEVLARGNRYGEAIGIARRGLELDPKNPELRALVSTALAELGDVDRAIREVVVDPHPLLRESLENHFADLATRADERNERRQKNRYLTEYLFLAIANRSGSDDPASLAQVVELNKRAGSVAREVGDARWTLTAALAALDIPRTDLAAGYAKLAAKEGLRLTSWQRDLLGDQLERLRAVPAWRALLDE